MKTARAAAVMFFSVCFVSAAAYAEGGPLGAVADYFSIWRTHQPRVYRVKQGAEGGDGSEERPFGSLRAAVRKLRAGDRLIVSAGVYKENVEFLFSGSESAPIILEGRHAVIDGSAGDPYRPAIDTKGKSHIRITGFTVRRSRAAVWISTGSRDVAVEKVKAWRCHFAVLMKNVADVRIADSRAYLCRNGFRGEGRTRDVMIERCKGFFSKDIYMKMDPDYLNGDAFIFERGTSRIVIRDSAGFRNWDSGFDIKASDARLDGVVACGNKNGLKLWGDGIAVVNALVYGSKSQVRRDGSRVDGMGVNVRSGHARIARATFADNEAEDIKVGERASLSLSDSVAARRLPGGKLLGAYGAFSQKRVLWYRPQRDSSSEGVDGGLWGDPRFRNWPGFDFALERDSPAAGAYRYPAEAAGGK